MSTKPLPSEHETRGSAFGYLDALRVLANCFGPWLRLQRLQREGWWFVSGWATNHQGRGQIAVRPPSAPISRFARASEPVMMHFSDSTIPTFLAIVHTLGGH
jgi:hypothetical protein